MYLEEGHHCQEIDREDAAVLLYLHAFNQAQRCRFLQPIQLHEVQCSPVGRLIRPVCVLYPYPCTQSKHGPYVCRLQMCEAFRVP